MILDEFARLQMIQLNQVLDLLSQAKVTYDNTQKYTNAFIDAHFEILEGLILRQMKEKEDETK